MNKPIVLIAGMFSEADVDRIKQTQRIFETVDIYEQQLAELFEILNPALSHKGEGFEGFKNSKGVGKTAGTWVYYPWSGMLLHCMGKEDLLALRTNRNQLLITKDEQKELLKAVVGIAGMSVGAGMAVAMAYSGISRTLKMADFDKLDTTNLNRLRESLAAVGRPKVELAARHIYELDPFADIQIFDKGVKSDNIEQFFSSPNLDVVIDEIDDFKIKIKLRLNAKKYKIPLIMFTSLGDNILVDVERYDIDPNQQPFNGLLPGLSKEILDNKEITSDDARRYAVQLVGSKYVPTRAIESLSKIGKELVGRPQLYSTIAVDGGLAAYVVKRLLLAGDIKAGRYFVSFSALFGVDRDDMEESSNRE